MVNASVRDLSSALRFAASVIMCIQTSCLHHLLSNVLLACLPVLMQRAWWVTAVVNSKKGPGNGSVYTEEDWNVESSVEDEPYRYSKVWKVPVVFCIKG